MHSPHVLRPTSATVISIIAWAFAAYLLADAVWKTGVTGLLTYGPLLALSAALVWAILWAPRVIVHQDSVEVRNVLHTYRAHYSAIDKVSIGAMVRIVARNAKGSAHTVTAWNAPGVGRDKPVDAAIRARHGGQNYAAERLGPEARLAHDQRNSPSWVLFERWDAWHDRHAESGIESETSVLNASVNWITVGIVSVCALATAITVVL